MNLGFMGEYHHSIDNKGRIIIPSKFRDILGESFIVTRGIDSCLEVYSKIEWSKKVEEYRNLPMTKDGRALQRFFLSGAIECEIDKQGRINITTPLINHSSLEKDCVVVGVNNRLEIWSLENWNNFMSAAEEDLVESAEKVFSLR